MKIIAWLTSVQKYIYGILAILGVLLIVFIKGCSYGRDHKKCPEIITNTVIIHDTIVHHISDTVPYYITKRDTVIYIKTVFSDVDTTEILKNYFAIYHYTRIWEDSLLKVTLKDVITENKSIDNTFSYQILRDQVIINNSVDNSVTYRKYLFGGVSMPLYPFKSNTISNINYIALEGLYAFPKGYFRIGWQPYTKTWSLGTGIKLLQFK